MKKGCGLVSDFPGRHLEVRAATLHMSMKSRALWPVDIIHVENVHYVNQRVYVGSDLI